MEWAASVGLKRYGSRGQHLRIQIPQSIPEDEDIEHGLPSPLWGLNAMNHQSIKMKIPCNVGPGVANSPPPMPCWIKLAVTSFPLALLLGVLLLIIFGSSPNATS